MFYMQIQKSQQDIQYCNKDKQLLKKIPSMHTETISSSGIIMDGIYGHC